MSINTNLKFHLNKDLPKPTKLKKLFKKTSKIFKNITTT
jgi:hypothetical protein